MDAPEGFCRESFYGFDLKDDEIEPSAYRSIAIEVKHLFESLVIDADERNQEFFLTPEMDMALRAFVKRPSNFTLCSLLSVAPHMHDSVREIAMLVSPSLLDEIPFVFFS